MENPPLLTTSEMRHWSLGAQLAFLTDCLIPGLGLVANVLIYKNGDRGDENFRHDAREALNAEITYALAMLACFGLGTWTTIAFGYSLFALPALPIFAFRLYVGVQNALAVADGRRARYAYILRFVQT